MARPLEKRKDSFRKEFHKHLMHEIDRVIESEPDFELSKKHSDRISKHIEDAVSEITEHDQDLSKAEAPIRFVGKRVSAVSNDISRIVDEAIRESLGLPKARQPTLELRGRLKGKDVRKQLAVEDRALDEMSDDLEKKEVSPHHDPKKGKWQPKDED